LAALPALATLGEGGASVVGLVAWHALVVVLVIGALTSGTVRRTAAGAPLCAWALFLILAALGAIRAPYAYAAWLNAVELAAVTAVFVLASRSGPNLARLAVWPVAFAAAAQSLLALFQRFALGQPRPAGTFLNPNHLGGFLVAALLLLAGEAWLARDERAPRRCVWAGLLAAPALAAALASGSRGALLAGAAGSAWLVCCMWRHLGKRQRLAVVASCLLVALPVAVRVGQRLRDTDPYMFHRLKIWRAATGPLSESPFWGSGPGQFAVAASRFQFDDGHGPLRFDRAFRITHSDLLRVPVEYGLPAALVLAVCAFAAVREFRRGRGTRDAVGSPGVSAALVAMAAQAAVDNPSRWPALYLLAALLLGSVLSRVHAVRPARPPRALRFGVAFVLVFGFLVGEVGPTVAYLKAAELPRGRLSSAESKVLDLASRLNPIQPDPWLRRADQLVAGTGPLSLDAYAEAREAAERAVRLSPEDSRYHWGLARVEGQACLRLFRTEASRDRTAEHLERAQQLSPFDARISLHAAEFGLAAGDPDYARRMAERALTLEPHAVGAHVLLARALLARNPDDRERASKLVEAAVRLAVDHAAAATENAYSGQLLTLRPERIADLREETAGAVPEAE
jgi:tetratricopeptide (TPR) repeat protein